MRSFDTDGSQNVCRPRGKNFFGGQPKRTSRRQHKAVCNTRCAHLLLVPAAAGAASTSLRYGKVGDKTRRLPGHTAGQSRTMAKTRRATIKCYRSNCAKRCLKFLRTHKGRFHAPLEKLRKTTTELSSRLCCWKDKDGKHKNNNRTNERRSIQTSDVAKILHKNSTPETNALIGAKKKNPRP